VIFTKSYWGGSGDGALAELRRTAGGVCSAYSGILFVEHPLIGVLFLLATFWFPNVGLAGLLAAAVGMAVGFVLRLPFATSGVNVYSSLLVGLSLGAYYELGANLILLIVLCSALTVLLAATMRHALWLLGHLPVLSVPFVIVALTAALAASTYGGLDPYHAPSQLPPVVLGGWPDDFLTSLGSVFFSPHPYVGALLFLGILVRSRYLAFLCLGGFLSGQFVFTILAADPPAGLLGWTGFNFALTAMALGGIFAVPSVAALAFALLGAAASAVVTGAMSRFLLVYGLPVMALPFLMTTLTLLAAMRLRQSAAAPVLLLETPGLPENNYERARLARYRLGALDSVPLLPPFVGEWQVYQGFDGQHTHKDQWRFALDFHRLESGQAFTGEGTRLEDFHCFGLPIFSPAYGTVALVQDSLADNAPGELDLANNWGNHVLIQTDSGLYVLLAHLQQFSVKIREGERVTPKSLLASCGSSGRSPQPHLHLQVQRHAGLGGHTVPFHLVSAIVRRPEAPPHFQLVARVGEGDSVERAEEDRMLASTVQLPAGRFLKYRFRSRDGKPSERSLTVEITLYGQFRVVTERGASAAFEQRNGTLAFFDRQGPEDEFLDLWLLALGLTPLSATPMNWQDSPSARLLPVPWMARALIHLTHPLGVGLESRYERSAVEEGSGAWRQNGSHQLRLWGKTWRATSTVLLDAERGCAEIGLEHDGERVEAELIALGQIADRGIPAWERTAAPSAAGLTED
jgi:urea transporter